MAIVWTKEWDATDDGTVLKGIDLKNIQDDINTSGLADADKIQGVDVDAPTPADDGKILMYDDGNNKYTYTDTSGIPAGLISLWSGSIATIPAGWTLCDGTAGTPDLTDRFVIHASADSGDTYDVGDTGGGTSGSTTLTSAQSGVPAHNHPQDANTIIEQAGAVKGGTAFGTTGGTTQNNTPADAVSGHTHDISGANVPPYYALAYIMKT